METLLNAIWLAIAVALFFIWRTRWLPDVVVRRKHAWEARGSFISLVCALALLFPAISLSDDLHPILIGLPGTKSSFVMAHSAAPSSSDSHSSSPAHSGVFGLPVARGLLLSGPTADLVTVPSAIAPHHGEVAGPDSSRAPPPAIFAS